MDRKLTVKQAEALALIEDNPGRVEAISRLRDDMLRVHGILEHALVRNGWVHKVEVGEHVRTAYGNPVTVMIYAWSLTQLGADKLRDHTLASQR